jgi:hypothetical protein
MIILTTELPKKERKKERRKEGKKERRKEGKKEFASPNLKTRNAKTTERQV